MRGHQGIITTLPRAFMSTESGSTERCMLSEAFMGREPCQGYSIRMFGTTVSLDAQCKVAHRCMHREPEVCSTRTSALLFERRTLSFTIRRICGERSNSQNRNSPSVRVRHRGRPSTSSGCGNSPARLVGLPTESALPPSPRPPREP